MSNESKTMVKKVTDPNRIKEMKKRIEHSYFEVESDKWSKFHDYIREIRLTINRGGIK